jgi:hypothetical protein
MIYLLVAQMARAAVIWTANRTAQKILRTVVVAAVGCYLIERVQRQKMIDEKRGYTTNEKSIRINS